MFRPIYIVAVILVVGCLAAVEIFIKPEVAGGVIAFFTLLGLLLNFIDRHYCHVATVEKVTQAANGLNRELIKNTEVTTEAAKGAKEIGVAINGRMSEMLESAKAAARAEGIIQGQNMTADLIGDLIAAKVTEAFNKGFKAGLEAKDVPRG